MNVELTHLMTDLADEAAAACVAGSSTLAARRDGDWHDASTLRGTASAEEFQRSLRYLQLRGRVVCHPTEKGLVRILDSGARPPAEADAAGEPDLLLLVRRYAWEFAQHITNNSVDTKRAADRSFNAVVSALAGRPVGPANPQGTLYEEFDCIDSRPVHVAVRHESSGRTALTGRQVPPAITETVEQLHSVPLDALLAAARREATALAKISLEHLALQPEFEDLNQAIAVAAARATSASTARTMCGEVTSTQTNLAEAPPPPDLRPHVVAYLANNLRTNGYEHHARTMEALAALRAAGEPIARDWKAIEAAIDEFLDGYELRLDEGCHTPTEFERFLIDDAISGLLSEKEILGLLGAVPRASAEAFDFHAHLARQREWSERTFGPGSRANGVIDHIRKELIEIESDPGDLGEWVDVIILALDGAWRSGATPQQIIDAIVAKQAKNEGRAWPDWRTMDPNKAIEHDRTQDSPVAEHSAKGEGDDLRKTIDNLDRDLGRTIDERDSYHRIADMLANAIAEHFGVDIGEHSSANCPWTNALDAFPAENADRQQRGGDVSEHGAFCWRKGLRATLAPQPAASDVPAPVDGDLRGSTVVLHFESAEAAERFHNRAAVNIAIAQNVAAQPSAGAEPSVQEATIDTLVKRLPHIDDAYLAEVKRLPRQDLIQRLLICSDWMGSYHHALDGIDGLQAIPGGGVEGCRQAREVRAIVTHLLSAQAAHKPDGGYAERIRNASAILDCLTSKLGGDHPLRLEAVEGAKRAVADLYRVADQIDAAISAQQRQGGGEGNE